MTSKIRSLLSRLAAPSLKHTLAILAACVVGALASPTSALADATVIADTLNNATAADDVVVTLAGETVEVDSITAASLTVNGYGIINVTGHVNVSGAVTFVPNTANAVYSAQPAFVSNLYTIKLSANTVNASTIDGGATIETVNGVSSSGGVFWGSIKGSGSFNVTGNIVVQGTSHYSGELRLSENSSFTVSSRLLDINDVTFAFDASDKDSFTMDESGNVSAFCGRSQASNRPFSLYNSTTPAIYNSGDNTHFGGKAYLQFNNSQYNYTSGINSFRGHSYIAVVHPDAVSSGFLVGYHSHDQDHFGLASSSWEGKTYGNDYNGLVFQNGTSSRTATEGTDTVVSFLKRITTNNNRGDTVGKNFVGAVAELVGFSREITLEDRAACEMYLMEKWNLSAAANFRPIPSSTDVIMGVGSTLDLGGYKQTVKSLSGSGTVQNGTLTVTDDINLSAGDVLTLPNTASFTLGTVAAKIDDTTSGTVTLCGSVQDAIDNYSAGTLTILASETVSIVKEMEIAGVAVENGAVLTFTQVPPFAATFEDGTLTATRVASTFVYTGAAAYSPTSGNFTIGGVATPAVPGTADTVQFDTDVELDVSSMSYSYAAIVLNADLTLTGSGNTGRRLNVNGISGTGSLVLGNGAVVSTVSDNATISAPVEVTASTDNAATLFIQADSQSIILTGALSGSGKLCAVCGSNVNFAGVKFRCSDASRFQGKIDISANDIDRNISQFSPIDLSGAEITVDIAAGKANPKFIENSSSSAIYKFGSLNGDVYVNAALMATGPCRVEIGALGFTDSVTGTWMSSNAERYPNIVKVGTGTLTTSATGVNAYILNGGTLVVMAAAAQANVTTELAGYKVASTVNYDTDGETVLSTTYTLESTKITWTGRGENKYWTTAGNWSSETVPTDNDFVVFNDGADVLVPTWATPPKCKYMTVNGSVTFTGDEFSGNAYCIDVNGGYIDGEGTITLKNCGLWNPTTSAITVSPAIVVDNTSGRDYLSRVDSDNGTWTLSGAITVNEGAKLRLRSVSATTQTITLGVGAWLVVPTGSSVTTGNIVVTGGAYFETVDSSDPAYVNNTASKWIGGSSGNWLDSANWSSGVYPRDDTDVTFEAGDGEAPASYTVYVGNDSTWAEGKREKCKNMVVDGYLTLAAKDSADGCHLSMFGDASGRGSLTLSYCGLDNGTWNPARNLTIGTKFCVASGNRSQFTNRNIGFNVTGESEFWGNFLVGGPATFANLALKDDVTVTIYNSWTEDTVYHQKGITVANMTVASGAQAIIVYDNTSATTPDSTITGTVTLQGTDSTLTVPANANVSDATFACGVNGYKVVGPNNNVYSVAVMPTASITGVTVAYGADFATATVTANVSESEADGSYTLTVGGATYTATAENGVVSFSDVVTGHATAYDWFSYEISSTQATVSGDAASGLKTIADEAAWFSTSASGTTGGSWNVSPWANENGGVVTSDNSFTPVASDASVVDVALQVCFGDANDDAIELTDAKAAVKIATVNNDLVFQALNDGVFVTLTGVEPVATDTYNVTLHLDYAAKKYTVKIGEKVMQYNDSELLAMPDTATAMSAVAFAGKGTLTSLVGETSEGYVAMDAAGNRYLTLDDALESEKSVTMLHAGTYGGTAYAKSDKVAPTGAANVPVAAASAEAAAASVKVALTAAQIQQGLKTSYYKTVATESGEGKYDVAITLNEDEVAPTVADGTNKAMDATETGVSFNVVDAKVGLYYGIAAGDSSNLGLSDVSGDMVKCAADGSLKLSNAALPTSGVKYYKVIVDDKGN